MDPIAVGCGDFQKDIACRRPILQWQIPMAPMVHPSKIWHHPASQDDGATDGVLPPLQRYAKAVFAGKELWLPGESWELSQRRSV